MRPMPCAPFTALDRRGIALPVALLALVALTLMVTTVMLTSSSEGAIARAHVDATQSLYDAEAGLVGFAMTQATGQAPFTAGTQTVALAGTGRRVSITTALLNSRALADNSTYRTWALTAEGIRNGAVSGRSITALVIQRTPAGNLGLNIQSAITLGGDLHVNGNSFTVNGHNACGAGAGWQAVQKADSSQVTVNQQKMFNNFSGTRNGGNTTGQGAIDSTHLTRQQLANQVLGNKTLASIIDQIPISKKWCSSTTVCKFKSGTPLVNRPLWPGSTPAGDSVAVVDGNGGTVSVGGGRGLLIVTNGNLDMHGNAKFDGIIIVEGTFTLSGTPNVTGSLISLAMNGNNVITQDDSDLGNGNIMVQFDQCKVDAAMSAFSHVASTVTTSSTTFAWAEMVR
jgi:hypothetical protein